MDKKFNVNVNNVNFHELEDVISINRDVDIGKHLPQDIIGKGAEFTNIRVRENIELSNLWAKLNSLMENLYIGSAGKLGLSAYKKLIDDENIKGGLEEQRKKIYTLWNMARIWTHRTLLKWLDVAVGNESYDVKLYYNDYGIEFRIFMDKGRVDHDYLIRNLRQIIPANLSIIWTLVYRQNIYVGMYSMPLIKRTYHPYYPGDIRVNFSVFVGICQSYVKKTRTYKLPDVMIYDYDNFIETTLERGEKINYDRD